MEVPYQFTEIRQMLSKWTGFPECERGKEVVLETVLKKIKEHRC